MDKHNIEDYRQFAEMVDRVLQRADPVPPFVEAPEQDYAPAEYASELDAIMAAGKRGLVHMF